MDLAEPLTFLVVILGILLAMTDQPAPFHYPGLRFLYRGGLRLYARSFPLPAAARAVPLERWRLEHIMVACRFSLPRAEPDGEGRFLLMEFSRPLWYYRRPRLMRGVLRWDTRRGVLRLRGYATWTYLLLLAFVCLPLALALSGAADALLCTFLLPGAYLLICARLWIRQVRRFEALGEALAGYLSAGPG